LDEHEQRVGTPLSMENGSRGTRVAVPSGIRLLWLIVASVIAFAALGVALDASPEGEAVLAPVALAIYAPALVLLGVAAYALHRRAPGTPEGAAPARAVIDAGLAGLVGGPVLLIVTVVITTIHDCATGTGC
jgi:hypothetical protein